MKKLSVIALMLAVLMLALSVTAGAASAKHSFPDNSATKTDVLAGLDGTTVKMYAMDSSATVSKVYSSDKASEFKKMFDGYAYRDADGEDCKDYLNVATALKNAAGETGDKVMKEIGDDESKFLYTLAGRKYLYYIDVPLAVPSSAGSFTIWYNNGKNTLVPDNQIDEQFDILVSKDNGATWTVAWESARMSYDAVQSNAVATGAANLTTMGGNSVIVGSSAKMIEGNFNQQYQNVTNVAYAVSRNRRGATATLNGVSVGNNSVAAYYSGRISEFDVYTEWTAPAPVPSGSTDPTPATGDNFAVYAILGVAVLTAGTVLVVRKKED